MLRDIPLKILLVFGFLVSGLIPVMIVALISYNTARDELRRQVFNQLEAARNLKKIQVEQLFQRAISDVEMLAANPYLLAATDELDKAYEEAGGWSGGEFSGLNDSYRAPAAYRTVHDRYFSFFSDYTARLGYYDLLLMEPERGGVFFTIKKEADFGPLAGETPSSLGDVWRTATQEGRTVLSDTKVYRPSGNAPAQFVAAPVRRDGRIIAVAALQISLNQIDAIMTQRTGMGATGETYLIGADHRMRSDSYLDPEGHSVAASGELPLESGGVTTAAATRALSGEEGAAIVTDYRSERVLSAFAPVRLPGLQWAIIAELDDGEIEAQITAALNQQILLVLASAAAIILLLALIISHFFQRQISNVTARIGDLSEAVLNGRLEARGDPELIGADFRDVVARINGLIAAFAKASNEKEQLETHLQRIQRLEAIGTLAGGIAHDFNNILTIIYAYAELLREELTGHARGEELLGELLSAVDRASALIGQMLTFSRQMKRQMRPLDLVPLVRELLKLLRSTMPSSITLESVLPAGELYIMGDPSQVHQILMNLATNSLHAMETRGGTLRIALESLRLDPNSEFAGQIQAPGNYCRLTVADTGLGMDADVRERMFEPFFTTKPVGKGTGLGLSVVHGIVMNYGGAISVWSEPGQGARIEILLPQAERSVIETTGSLVADTNAGAARILFVDDEDHICAAAEQMLASLGYRVSAVAEPQQALSRFDAAADEFDAVITDLRMPGMSGLELARQLHDRRPELPIILTTGYGEIVADESLDSGGIAELLMKPYRSNDLARALQRVLACKPPSSKTLE